MRQSAVFLALAALAAATPVPQLLDLATIIAPDEVAPNVTIPMGKGATSQVVTYVAPVLPSVAPAPSGTALAKRDGDCSPQPAGSGPVPNPDTDTAFLADSELANIANSANTPSGYTLAFQNLQGSSQTSAYLGYYSYDSYDTGACAAKCSSTTGCLSFNILFERDPSLDPGSSCPNPASTTVIKCVLWGTVITPETATNTGQYRSNFHVVIAGSNGYVRSPSSADPVPGYTGTYVGNAAVNAPLDCNGHSTYITYKEFSDGQPFSAARCAAACEAETQYNIQHLNSRSICRFFNTYLLLKNGVPQGQICSLYNTTWPATPDILSNTGQYSGSDHYTIADSEIYSDINDPGEPICPSDIAYLEQPDNAAFCSSYISYVAPTTTVSAITTVSTATTTTVDVTVASTPSAVTVTAAPRLRRSDGDASAAAANSINTDIFPWAKLPASILSTLTATTSGVNKRAALPTPASVASWPASMLSAACSEVATGTVTQTTVTGTSTVFTTTQTVLSTTTSVAPAPTVTVTPALTCFYVKDTTTGDYLDVASGYFAGASSDKVIFKQYTIAGQQSYIITTSGLLLSSYTYHTYNDDAALGYVTPDYFPSGQTTDPSNFIEVTTCLPTSNNGLVCSRGDHASDVLAVQGGTFHFFSGNLPSGVQAAVLVTETVACP